MQFLKIGLIAGAMTVFVLACSNTKPTTNVTNNSTNAGNSAAINTVAPPATPADELAAVRKIFSEECVKCHKETGKGGESVVDGKKVKAPDFTSEKLKSGFDEADWADVITNGEGSKMPAFGKTLSESDIKNLVKLIRKDFQGK